MSNGFLNNENNAADTMITINARIYARLSTYVLRNRRGRHCITTTNEIRYLRQVGGFLWYFDFLHQ
jgi:hypothetical protein